MSHSAMPEQQPQFESPRYEPEQRGSDFDRPPTDEHRLLRRSKQDRVIGGVCGGLARYFGADPVLFRIGFLALLIPGGLGLLLYIIAWIVIPEFKTAHDEQMDTDHRPVGSRIAGAIIGGALILIGIMILLDQLIDWFDPRIMGGLALVVLGAIIVIRGMQSEARR
jgi:phage shock protein C